MDVKIGIAEFLWKFLVVIFVIMPICMGICFWIGVQADAVLNVHLMKFIMPFVGSAVGFFFTVLLLQVGHKNVVVEESQQQPVYSDRLVSKHFETETESLLKASLPSRRAIKPSF
jgi:hypothetical protein